MADSRLSGSAIKYGDLMHSIGRGLETAANLLGCDGSNHDLTNDDFSGLLHAVRAIGGLLGAAGDDLYEAAEMAGGLEKRDGKK